MSRVRIRFLGLRAALVVAVVGCVLMASPATLFAQEPVDRQIVMFGVKATPNSSAMDPKIPAVVAAQLRKTLPGHGFKLIEVQSHRVMKGQSVSLNLGAGFETSATLLNPLDINGKVQMKYDFGFMGLPQFQSIVNTPTDQFNYFDKMLPDNSHFLIGVGAR